MNYTTGQWKLGQSNTNRIEIINEETLIATVWRNGLPEMKANAQLISASPELYVALIKAKDLVWSYKETEKHNMTPLAYETYCNLYQECLKALTKAEGKNE